ncbi:MAG: hypothetical protein HF314_13805 [Ignavibacteria bacterium]|jgi:hypothetical protein|nr:hypothetical protein [Ignavibacteria bacterium]MCU7504153.1 hypothetical protein [Ignavibacteria bacterium]MCU7516397.1 hypothetical protein [Ignavibacteria bacterium]
MVNIEGDLTINRMSGIKNEITKHIGADPELNVAISNIEKMDATFIQLLIGLENASSGIQIETTPDDKKKIYGFIKSYGYYGELNLQNTEN